MICLFVIKKQRRWWEGGVTRDAVPTREHCLAVKELYCHKEWLTLEGSAARTTAASSLLPGCQALPSLHRDPDACTHVPLVGESFTGRCADSLIHQRACMYMFLKNKKIKGDSMLLLTSTRGCTWNGIE